MMLQFTNPSDLELKKICQSHVDSVNKNLCLTQNIKNKNRKCFLTIHGKSKCIFIWVKENFLCHKKYV